MAERKDDITTQALNPSHDFYELLDVQEGASESEIRRAYRKTALKYHPDKVGPKNEKALEKFHLLQIAYDVLSDPAVRELYNNARRARAQKAERESAYEGRRKWMKEDLERRESGALKRRRDESQAEEAFERELERLARDGKRRRKEREEMLRRQADDQNQEQTLRHADEEEDGTSANANERAQVNDIDRSVTLRFPQTEQTKDIDQSQLISRFARFGPIEEAILRDKKIKTEGEKHRKPYTTAVLLYRSVVGAHALVTDFDEAARTDPKLQIFETVGWAGGKEPDFIPKPSTPVSKSVNTSNSVPSAPSTPLSTLPAPSAGLRKAPSFGSFKATARPSGSPSLDEVTRIRLKNAEKRRLEEKIRREEGDVEQAPPTSV